MSLYRSKISVEEMARLYAVEFRTLREIAEVAGISYQCVRHHLRSAVMPDGVTYGKMSQVRCRCKNCGEFFVTNRKRVKLGAKYCSPRCYFADTSLYGKFGKNGQRQGRLVSDARKGEVVHHINGDTFDNRPENLIVFNNNAQHAGFHKSGAAKWFLDSVNRGKIVMDGVLRWPK